MDTERIREGLREHTAAFADAVRGIDPDTWVATCPQWRLRTLVGHIGQEHRWAARIVSSGKPAAIPDVRDADPGSPDMWADWLNDGAEQLISAAAAAGATAPVWALTHVRPARFWLRRMLADTAVHHADACLTSGTRFTIAPDVAADVISEGLELLAAPGVTAFKPGLRQLRGSGQTLCVAPDEPDLRTWLITRTPEGPIHERPPCADGSSDTTVAGPVRDLLLVLTRRIPPHNTPHSAVTVTGDRAPLEHWLAHAAL